MKPSYVSLCEDMRRALGRGANVLEEHKFAIGWLCQKLDEQDERLAMLEADASPPEELDPTKPLYVGDGGPRVAINKLAQGIDLASEKQLASPCAHCGKPCGAIVCTTSIAPAKIFCSVDCSQTAYTPDATEPEQ